MSTCYSNPNAWTKMAHMHDDVRLAKIVTSIASNRGQCWTRDLGFNSSYSMPGGPVPRSSGSSLVGPFGPGPAEPKALAFCHMNKSTEGKIPKYVKGYFRL